MVSNKGERWGGRERLLLAPLLCLKTGILHQSSQPTSRCVIKEPPFRKLTLPYPLPVAHTISWEGDACNSFANNSGCPALVQWPDFRPRLTDYNATD